MLPLSLRKKGKKYLSLTTDIKDKTNSRNSLPRKLRKSRSQTYVDTMDATWHPQAYLTYYCIQPCIVVKIEQAICSTYFTGFIQFENITNFEEKFSMVAELVQST